MKKSILTLTLLSGFSASLIASGLPKTEGDITHSVDASYLIAKREVQSDIRLKHYGEVALGYAGIANVDAVNELLDVLRNEQGANEIITTIGKIAVSIAKNASNNDALRFVKSQKNVNERYAAVDGFVAHLLTTGKVELAYTIANEIQNTARRNRLLTDIADSFAEQNNTKRALEIIDSLPAAEKNSARQTISRRLSRQQDYSKATEVALSIQNAPLSEAALLQIVKDQSESRRFEDAAATMRLTITPSTKQIALEYIAIGHIRAQQFYDAKKFTDQITAVDSRDAVLSAAAIEYAKLGDIIQAEKILGQLMPQNQSNSRYLVARALSADENFEKAFELVNQLPQTDRAIYLPQIATEFGKSPQFLFSQLLINQISPESLRLAATEQFIAAYATHGNYKKVVKMVSDLSDPRAKDRTISSVVDIYLDKREYESALDLIKLCQSIPTKTNLYIKISQEIPQEKERQDHFDRIETEIQTYPQGGEKIDAFIALADAYIKTTNNRRAEEILRNASGSLEMIKNNSDRQVYIARLIYAYERTKRSAEGLFLVREFLPKKDRVSFLLTLSNENIQDPDIANRRQSLLRDISRQ